ncbi:unnamed protein product [Brachionus calyciflorus]|uniref:CCHC-type domain-containing protein n=1 Tax=Brachionus calyciflorus TaxID=104777 RepID=A0A813UT47_9BILA|nr:unnamed protein product [Brachionus calyciflorus]
MKNDIATLKKVQKWTKNILNRIRKNTEKVANNLNEEKQFNNEQTAEKKIKNRIVPMMISNISKQQLTNVYLTDHQKHDKEYYEQKYKQDYYDVIICGDRISEYSNIYERIDEIKRCTGVKSFEMVLPIFDKVSNKTKLKIRVKELLDYKALNMNWPLDSFKSGVKVYKTTPILKVVILDVTRKFKTSLDNNEINDLINKYGFKKIHRLYNHKKNPCSKLIATCKSISDYVDVLRKGIYIGSKKHVVIPNIINYRVCSNCGSLKHQKKECHKEQRCLKCAEIGHEIFNCKSKFNKCINCLGSHKCFTDTCKEFSKKKLYINRFVVKILIGENLIKNTNEILLNRNELNQEHFLESKSSEAQLSDRIESILASKLNSCNSKIRIIEEVLINQALSIQVLKDDIHLIRENIPDIDSSINNIQETLNSLKTNDIVNIKANIDSTNESVAQIYTKSINDYNEFQKILIDIVKYLKLPES